MSPVLRGLSELDVYGEECIISRWCVSLCDERGKSMPLVVGSKE